MKFLTSFLVTTLVLVSVTMSPSAKSDVGAALAGICDVVASDNKSRFRKKMKEAGVKLRNIYDGISCGGQNLVRYSMSKGAQKTGVYIVKRMPGSHFAGSGDTDWAGANGFGDTDIAKAIADR